MASCPLWLMRYMRCSPGGKYCDARGPAVAQVWLHRQPDNGDHRYANDDQGQAEADEGHRPRPVSDLTDSLPSQSDRKRPEQQSENEERSLRGERLAVRMAPIRPSEEV